MMKIIIGVVVLVIVVIVLYSSNTKMKKKAQDELLDAFLKLIARNLKQNLEKLEKGDLGWRRLGHGQATIGLKKVAPKKADVVPVSLDTVEEKHPDIVREIREVDSKIVRMQTAADDLAKKIEAPVRESFQKDRQTILDQDDSSTREFRKWLIDREDGWMSLLANLVNSGQTLNDKSDPATLYWKHSKSVYHKVLEENGGREREDLQLLTSNIKNQSKSLLKKIDDMKSSNNNN